MKKLLATLTVVAVFVAAFGFAYPGTASAGFFDEFFDDLVGYWPADVDGDDPALDATGNGNHMNLGAANTFPDTDDPAYDCTLANIAPTPGNVCGLEFTSVFSGGDFTPDSDFATVPNANILDVTSAYTLSAWVRVDNVLAGGVFTYRPILVRGADDGSDEDDIEVYVQAISKDLIVLHNRGNGGSNDFVGFVDPPLDTIFHLAVRCNGADVNVFYDGVSQAVTQNTTAMASDPLDTDKDWLIGKFNHGAFVNLPLGSGPEKFFEGLIDEVMIFDSALTDAQIAILAAGVVAPGQVSFCLDTPAGAVVNDQGCSIDQICPCGAPLGRTAWRNHGEYVTCVTSASAEFLEEGRLTKAQRRDLVRQAAQSACGQ